MIVEDNSTMQNEQNEMNLGAKAYAYQPKTNEALKELVRTRIAEDGIYANLNDIDVSKITNMTNVFRGLDFHGNISQWDMSGVTVAYAMFMGSTFDGDISAWDMSALKDATSMFADSKFNGNIGGWDMTSLETAWGMFRGSEFTGDISSWDTPALKNSEYMFSACENNSDISGWDITSLEYASSMFEDNCCYMHDLSALDFTPVIGKTNVFLNCPMRRKPQYWPTGLETYLTTEVPENEEESDEEN